MSGGDLDGDVYMVIRDKDLVKDFKESDPAVNSHKTDQVKKEKKMETDEVAVLKNFYENDYLGLLSTKWSAFVDNPKFGNEGSK